MQPVLALESPQELRATLGRLDTWLRARDFAGYDPYDSLNASRLPAFFRATPRRRQLVVQVGKRSPVNLRPILRRATAPQQQGAGPWSQAPMRGFIDWSAILRGSRSRAPSSRSSRRVAPKSRGTIAWGYEFDVQTRWAFYPRGTPNIIVTTFVAHAFLDWYELTGDSSLLATADGGGALLERRASARRLTRATTRTCRRAASSSTTPTCWVAR